MSDEPKPVIGETTGAQLISTAVVSTSSFMGSSRDLPNNLPKTYATYRTMRVDPTLSLARTLSISPILAGEWSVERKDEFASDGMVKMIQDWVIPLRDDLVGTAMLGGVDFGWQGFEKVFNVVDGALVVTKVKPLLQDITTILVRADTGLFAGFKQTTPRGVVVLPLDNSLIIPFRMEGTQYHGQSLMEVARVVQGQWVESNKAAGRYDQKIAGANFVVYYPVGSSEGANEVEQNNADLAKEVLAALESTGSVLVPIDLAEYVEDLNKQRVDGFGWRIELLSDKAPKQGSFVARLKYLDVQKVRALGMPERMVLEGTFGTKAEAGVHTNLALTQMDLLHSHITKLVNWHLVDQMLALNFGEQWRGAVKLTASPLVDAKLVFLQELYAAIVKNPAGFQAEFPSIDLDSVREQLGVPAIEDPIDAEDNNDDLLDMVPKESDAELAASAYADITNAK